MFYVMCDISDHAGRLYWFTPSARALSPHMSGSTHINIQAS